MSSDMRAVWDAEAATFDEEPDHGLVDPTVRAAWRQVLLNVLPPQPARILDLGCGTGSISVLLAEMGHSVTGIDLSPRMIEQATAKAHRHAVAIDVRIGDAADPPLIGYLRRPHGPGSSGRVERGVAQRGERSGAAAWWSACDSACRTSSPMWSSASV